MKSNTWFISILVIFTLYSGFFIYETSTFIEGQRYFILFDDEMISMRYADNLASGHGMVWNPDGDKVEGYTNPLWVMYMAFFHLFPIPKSKISLCIQLSGLLFLLLNLFYVRKIAQYLSNNHFYSVLLAVVLTTFYYPLNYWSLQGLEVSLLTFIMTLSIWYVLKSLQDKKVYIRLFVLLGIGTLLRLDMCVPALGIIVYLAFTAPENRKLNIGYGLTILALFLIGQTLFRMLYYGDVLPNTYYLKVTGSPILIRLTQGVTAAFKFIVGMNWVLFILPLTLLFYRREKSIYLFYILILLQILYSIYVGGDAWEWMGGSNRYITIVIPAFFILFALSLVGLVNALMKFGGNMSNSSQKYGQFSILIFGFCSLVTFNSSLGSESFDRWILQKIPFHCEHNPEMVKMALLIDKITTTDAKIAVVWAGIFPYFADRYTIDMLGKNDVKIAHEPSHDSKKFYPGHMKWDYDYSIGEFKPDVVLQVWALPEKANVYLDKDYIPIEAPGFDLSFERDKIFLRKDSQFIDWKKAKRFKMYF